MSKFKVGKYFLERGMLHWAEIGWCEIEDNAEYGKDFGGKKILDSIGAKLHQAIVDKSNKKDWAWIEIEYEELGWYDYWLEHYQMSFENEHQAILDDPNELEYFGCDYFAESKNLSRKLRKAFNTQIQSNKDFYSVI